MSTIALGFDDRSPSWSAVHWVADRATRAGEPTHVTVVVTGFHEDERDVGPGLGEALRELRATGAEVQLSTDVTTRGMVTASGDHELLVAGVPRGDRLRLSDRWFPSRLIHESPAPVCFVPDGWEPRDLEITVGVAADESSDAAVMFAAREAARENRDLRLVHASREEIADNGSPQLHPLEVLDGAELAVRRLAGGVPLVVQAVVDEPAIALTVLAERSSMIVLGTHRRGFLSSGVLGSVALDVLGRVPCPVVVVPPRA